MLIFHAITQRRRVEFDTRRRVAIIESSDVTEDYRVALEQERIELRLELPTEWKSISAADSAGARD